MTETLLRVTIFHDRERQSGECIVIPPGVGDDGDERGQSGVDVGSGRVTNQRLAFQRFEELLPAETNGLSRREQDPGDQPAVAAAFSSWSTQLAKR